MANTGLRERRRLLDDNLSTLHLGTLGYDANDKRKMASEKQDPDQADACSSSAARSLLERRLPNPPTHLDLSTLHPGTLRDLKLEAEEYVLARIHDSNPLHYLGSLFKSWCKERSPLVSPSGFSASKLRIPPSSPCLDTSEHTASCELRMSWSAVCSIIFLKSLLAFAKPVEFFGNVFEYHLNLMYLNHGLKRTLHTCLFNPGLVDPRQELCIEEGILSDVSKLDSDAGMKSMADVCAMASKIAYENEKVIKKAVEQEWKMNFVQFYDCWNEYLECKSTQGFIFTDKKQNANIIVVAFRGTQLFNMYDWCTDFDFSYYVLPEMGRVHVGFLEALGLGSRLRRETLKQAKVNTYMKASKVTPAGTPTSGLSGKVINDNNKVLAYDAMSAKVQSLLRKNLGAKLYITGHSLGGALATLFSALLLVEGNEACSSLGGIFTFGQPRVGDAKFASYMEKKLCRFSPHKYFRVVYRTDIVPRVPFDDSVFQFKHLSPCHYYSSSLESKALLEEPYKSLFMLILIPMPHVNALKELFASLRLRLWGRGEGHVETGLCIMVRCFALLCPGLCAHFPSCYVDAIRGASSSFLLEVVSLQKRGWLEVMTWLKLWRWCRPSTHEHMH